MSFTIKPKIAKLISGFIRKYKSINIPQVLIKLFVLYFYQQDSFEAIIPFDGRKNINFTILHQNQTAMRNDIEENALKQIYGRVLIKQSVQQKEMHIWRIKVNNIPLFKSHQQVIFGVSNAENHYTYYGINNELKPTFKISSLSGYKVNYSKKHIHIHNINDLERVKMRKDDIITIKLILDSNQIYAQFYINNTKLLTYKKLNDSPYKLFISTNTLFVSFTLEYYECAISF